MALKKTLTDPLNWLLAILAIAFGYYVFAVPYFTRLYLKSPQEMGLVEYLANPSHPRPFMAHALSAPPSSMEILVTDLRVEHIDQDSILLVADLSGAETDAAAPEMEPVDEAPAEEPVAAGTGGEVAPEAAPEPEAEADDEEGVLVFQPEAPAPNDQILIPGENLDLLPISVGQVVSIQVHDLHESPLGWVPQEPHLASEEEEFFIKEELDDLQLLKIVADGNILPLPYVETGELRFANGVHPPGEPLTLTYLDDDTSYIQTVNRLAGGLVDLYDLRIVEHERLNLLPVFVAEDAEGRRARIYYNTRLLSEWYWVMDRLGGYDVVIRARLRPLTPPELRALESESNVQVAVDGVAVLSRDGTMIINLENPIGAIPGM